MSTRNNRLETCLLAAATAFGLAAFAGNVLYDYTINRKRKMLLGPKVWKDEDVVSGMFKKTDLAEETLDWAESTPISHYSTIAGDGINLSAYGFEQSVKSHLWVIAVPEYAKNAASLFPVARQFYSKGYNTLLMEPRGVGKSGGNAFGLGWLDRLDVICWIREIIKGDSAAQIVLFGLCTGADAVMMASGEALPSNVRCIIEDSGYSNLTDMANYLIKSFNLLSFPLNIATSMVTLVRAGFTFREASAVNQVALSSTPILFIHGGMDKHVPPYMAYELYESATCVKDLLIIPNASHAYAMYSDSDHYWARVSEFINRFVDKEAAIQATGGIRQRVSSFLRK